MEIGLYFHIPFCASKCYYCDFLSFPNQKRQEDYIKALVQEMASVSQSLASNTHVSTIFIGGGTPTVLPPVLIEQLLSGIVTYFNLTADCEWTIEANPGTLTYEKIQVMKQFPITRISMGLQSTHNHLLKAIGRGHAFKDWEESIHLVRTYTDWQVNADLMFALPGQTFEEFKQTLDTVCQYHLEHLSLYALIIEEGTVFGRLYEKGELKEAPEELDRQMYHYAKQYLKEQGYIQYEISNWSKKDKICRHNKVYWTLKPYIGLGLGAHSFDGEKRFYNEQNIDSYISAAGELQKLRYEEELMTCRSMMEEYLFLGLRMLSGIDERDFKQRFQKDLFEIYGRQLKKWLALGLLRQDGHRIYLSERGLDVCNEVFSSFLETDMEETTSHPSE